MLPKRSKQKCLQNSTKISIQSLPTQSIKPTWALFADSKPIHTEDKKKLCIHILQLQLLGPKYINDAYRHLFSNRSLPNLPNQYGPCLQTVNNPLLCIVAVYAPKALASLTLDREAPLPVLVGYGVFIQAVSRFLLSFCL